ncbi:MAG: hypothetical protein AAF577_10270 [Pseudomonadota bacterium]
MGMSQFVPPPAEDGWVVTLVVETDPNAPYGAGDAALMIDDQGQALGRATVIGRTDGITPGIQALTLFGGAELAPPAALRRPVTV